jgi:hypothetical protein
LISSGIWSQKKINLENCNSAFESKLEAILNFNVIPTSDGRMPQSLKD